MLSTLGGSLGSTNSSKFPVKILLAGNEPVRAGFARDCEHHHAVLEGSTFWGRGENPRDFSLLGIGISPCHGVPGSRDAIRRRTPTICSVRRFPRPHPGSSETNLGGVSGVSPGCRPDFDQRRDAPAGQALRGKPSVSGCSSQRSGRAGNRLRPVTVSVTGCRPSRISSTMSGAR